MTWYRSTVECSPYAEPIASKAAQMRMLVLLYAILLRCKGVPVARQRRSDQLATTHATQARTLYALVWSGKPTTQLTACCSAPRKQSSARARRVAKIRQTHTTKQKLLRTSRCVCVANGVCLKTSEALHATALSARYPDLLTRICHGEV